GIEVDGSIDPDQADIGVLIKAYRLKDRDESDDPDSQHEAPIMFWRLCWHGGCGRCARLVGNEFQPGDICEKTGEHQNGGKPEAGVPTVNLRQQSAKQGPYKGADIDAH